MTTINRRAGAILAAVALALTGGVALAQHRWGPTVQASGVTRYYQVATPEMVIRTTPPYHNNEAALSFAIDRPGRVVAIHMIPTQAVRTSMEDRVVGSVWVNASNGPTIDDLFAITFNVPPMTLHKLADVGLPATGDMPVMAGDVVTVLLGDEQSGAPPLPAATWVLEVEE